MSRIKPQELAGALGQPAADKRLQILRAVGGAGSISRAAREAGVSYKAAWQALDTLGNLAGAPLVEKVVGGAGGGGAHLTAAGLQLLRAADELARSREQVLARLSRSPRASGAAALALRTSMRNQLPCTVERLRQAGGAVDVLLRLPGGQALASRVTRESAQLLGLRAGLGLLALFKATAVAVQAGTGEAGEPNVLAGTVARAVRDAGEIVLELPGGQRVVGFAAAGHGLRKTGLGLARVAPAAVVLALAG